MENIVTDKTCTIILTFFFAANKKFGFNELLRSLNGLGRMMSKPTLSEHLKHLTENKVLTRKEEGKQRVYYEINWEMFENLRDVQKDGKTFAAYFENKKRMQSFPLDEQLMYVSNILTLKSVSELRLRILRILDPDRLFNYSLESMLSAKYYEYFVSWLLQSCAENKEEFREKALPLIEANIDRIKKIVFDQRPISNE